MINVQSYSLSFNKVKDIELVVDKNKIYTIQNVTPGDESPSSTPCTHTRISIPDRRHSHLWLPRRTRTVRERCTYLGPRWSGTTAAAAAAVIRRALSRRCEPFSVGRASAAV
uniref:Uncharacterized protein n=1 Tax=Sipha flava TaxID=143950 RepID=A0A2S2RAB2_9HEMI